MKKEKGCDFCCNLEEGKLYPKEGYTFYAGFSKQFDVDRFHEQEVENINFCPICGKELHE